MSSVNLYSHRGIHDNKNVIENTIESFKKALEYNMNIELDIRVTKDEKIVVFHDDNLKRLTSINKKIKNLTYKELNNINLKDKDIKIPLLEDVLKLVDGKVTLLIELKEVLSYKVLKKIDRLLLNYNGKVLFQSFNPIALLRLKKTSLNRYKVGILLTNKYRNMKKIGYELFIYKCFIDRGYCNFISVPKDLLSKVKNMYQLELFVFTINSKDEFIKYSKEVNNLICNKFDI